MKSRTIIIITMVTATAIYLGLSISKTNGKETTLIQSKQVELKSQGLIDSATVTENQQTKSKALPLDNKLETAESVSATKTVKSTENEVQEVEKKLADVKKAEKLAADRERLVKSGLKLKYDDGKTLKEFSHYESNRPVYRTTHNVNAAISAGVKEPAITNLGLTGSGVRVGVWDGGSALHTHLDYDGRVTIKDGATNHYHATHVIGTITGSGATSAPARGMAPSTTVWSYDWNSDGVELSSVASSSGAGLGVRISNHSYGYIRGWSYDYVIYNDNVEAGWVWNADISQRKDPYYGKYSSTSREYDSIVYTKKYVLPFISAGNSQRESPTEGNFFYYYDSLGNVHRLTYNSSVHPYSYAQTLGYETIGSLAMAKNIVTVGAVSDAVNYGQRDLNGAFMSSFSSFGPSDDGRIKPDLVANGVGLYSTSVDGNNQHENMSGTSMSSPSAAGTAALLQEYYFNQYNKYMWASTLKGLLIHGADDLGREGPDYQYGWGLINLSESIKCLQKYEEAGVPLPPFEDSLSNGEAISTEIVAAGTTPLKVTLCWSDAPGVASPSHIIDDRTPALVNDLDLVLRGKSGTVYYPYKLNPENPQAIATAIEKNGVDNVEQVYFAVPSESFYTVEITHKGTLSSGKQDFSLIISGTGGGIKLLDGFQAMNEGENLEHGFGTYDLKNSDYTRILTLSNTMADDIDVSSITVSGNDGDKFAVEYDFQSVEAGKDASIFLRSLNRNVGSLSATLNVELAGVGEFKYKFTLLAAFEHFPLNKWGDNWSIDSGWTSDFTELALGSTTSFKSARIGDSRTTEFSYTGPLNSGDVTFWAKCSSETHRDGLVFLIDGVSQNDENFMLQSKSSDSFMYSGDKSWAYFSFPVSSGVHTLAWRYEKDSSYARYEDCIWVDKVVLPLNRSFNSATLFDVKFETSENGIVLGKAEQLISYFTETTPVAIAPKLGYEFLEWSDGDVSNPRVVSGISDNVTLTAVYEGSPKFTVEFMSSEGGTVVGELQQEIFRRGSSLPVIAQPDVGYEFSSWSNREQEPIITLDNISENETVTAHFVAKEYNVSVVPANNGTVIGELNQTVVSGGSSNTISATADNGYSFVCWINQTDGTVVSYESTLALNRVSENLTLTPLFSDQIVDESFTLNYEGWHLVSAELDYVNPTYLPNDIYEWIDGAYARPVSIENITGLWVYHDTADSMVVNYSGLTSTKTKTLENGWNLYAPSIDRIVSPSELVYTWNGTHYNVVSSGELLTTDKAYWLFSYE